MYRLEGAGERKTAAEIFRTPNLTILTQVRQRLTAFVSTAAVRENCVFFSSFFNQPFSLFTLIYRQFLGGQIEHLI